MATTRKQPAPTYDELRQFSSAEEIEPCIDKLRRRIKDVEELKGVRYDDQAVANAQARFAKLSLGYSGPTRLSASSTTTTESGTR